MFARWLVFSAWLMIAGWTTALADLQSIPVTESNAAFPLNQTPPSIGVTPEAQRVSLDARVALLRVPAELDRGTLPDTAHWQLHAANTPVNLGFTEDGVWLHARVHGAQPAVSWYLAIPYPLLQQVRVYATPDRSAGSLTPPAETDALPRASLRSHHQLFALPPMQGDIDLLIYARSGTSLQVPLELWRSDYAQQRQMNETLMWGLYFGILFALLAYNGFVHYSVRDAAYAWYVGYLGAIGGLMLSISGFGPLFLWPADSRLAELALPLFSGISSWCGLQFTALFLAQEDRPLPLRRALTVARWLVAGVMLYSFVEPSRGAELSAWLSSVVLSLIIVTALRSLQQGVVIARYFLLAWTCLAAGSSLYLLNVFGQLPMAQVASHSLQLGSALEVILLSLALAHRIKIERAQKMTALQQQHRAERQIREMQVRALESSMHDRNTGFPNDSLLLARMRELCTPSRPTPFYLVSVSFPHLREVSATLGQSLCHTLFRTLLQELDQIAVADPESHCIEPQRQHYVAVTDLGHAAFLIRGEISAETIEARIRARLQRFSQAVALGPLSLVMDAYAGIVRYPDHAQQPDALLQRALLARDAGIPLNRRVNLYNSELDDAGRRRLALIGALTQAMVREELELYLQPQFGCHGLDLRGAEILLRWHSRDYGQIPPQEFIEIAEQAGLMDRLTQYVVLKSLKLLCELQQLGIRLKLSINLSVQNLMEPDFAEFIIKAAQCHAIRLEDLILEVTETAMNRNMDCVADNLRRLSDSGASIALDDFGTGYSSLTYLSRLPIRELKIDKSFILHMRRNESDLRIVENTIKLAHALHLDTVAEGIEDAEALDLVTRLGCTRVQGYHTGRPMDVAGFKAWALRKTA